MTDLRHTGPPRHNRNSSSRCRCHRRDAPLSRSWRRKLSQQRSTPGRVAIIIGADSGIGCAVAIAYAREGADEASCVTGAIIPVTGGRPML